MKRTVILILLCAAVSVIFAYSTPMNKETVQHKWVTMRSGVAANDVAITATTKTWALRPTAKMFEIPSGFNNIEIRFRGNDAAATATYTVYFYADNDDAIKVVTGNLTSGDQTATMGGYYVDTITTTSTWMTSILTADVSAGNGMGRIAFDATGYKWIFVEFTSISASDTISADIRGF